MADTGSSKIDSRKPDLVEDLQESQGTDLSVQPSEAVELPALSSSRAKDADTHDSGKGDLQLTRWKRFRPRLLQLGNFVYFAFGAFCCLLVATTCEYIQLPAEILAGMFVLLGLVALCFSLLGNRHLTAREVFSLKVQKRIRKSAIVITGLAIGLAIWNFLGLAMLTGVLGGTVGRGPNGIASMRAAMTPQTLEMAAQLSPFNTNTAETLSELASLFEHNEVGLSIADKYHNAFPNDPKWERLRLQAMAGMPEKATEFETEFERFKQEHSTYVKDFWSKLASSARSNENYPKALYYATRNIEMQPQSWMAYLDRAVVLEKLGRTAESKADLATSENLRNRLPR